MHIFIFYCFFSLINQLSGFNSYGKLGKRSLYMNQYDFDLAIIGCGVGGHAAALHARSKGLKTAVLTGKDLGGTCVNRGCIPSKALLAASGRIRELNDEINLKSFGIAVNGISIDRLAISNHANQLANKIKSNLEASLIAQGVEIIESKGVLTNRPTHIFAEALGKEITAKNIILAPGSVPLIPRGITVDEKSVLTSDGGLKLDFIPQVI